MTDQAAPLDAVVGADVPRQHSSPQDNHDVVQLHSEQSLPIPGYIQASLVHFEVVTKRYQNHHLGELQDLMRYQTAVEVPADLQEEVHPTQDPRARGHIESVVLDSQHHSLPAAGLDLHDHTDMKMFLEVALEFDLSLVHANSSVSSRAVFFSTSSSVPALFRWLGKNMGNNNLLLDFSFCLLYIRL